MIITCPKCSHKFPLADDVLTNEISSQISIKLEAEKQEELAKEKAKLNATAEEFNRKRNLEIDEHLKMLATEHLHKEKLIKEKIESTNAAEMAFLKEANEQQKIQIKEAQEKDIEILKLRQSLDEHISNTAHENKKLMIAKEQEFKIKYEQEASLKADEKHHLKIRELEKQLEAQQKLTEESQRKLNQGSMEIQGEVQEDFIKEQLQKLFPYDEIIDVKKGQKGGDLIQYVKNSVGETCGIILYESKNTKAWQNEWIIKLNEDKRKLTADIGVIISQTLPKGIKNIGQDTGIWICGIKEFEGVAAMLRSGIVEVHIAKRSEDNKADKMVMLYDYLNSNDFKQKWDGILDGFRRMKKSIEDQRNHTFKHLAEQDAIINTILMNGNLFLGSIKGISGSSLDEMKMLE
jgi:hypothetical protein